MDGVNALANQRLVINDVNEFDTAILQSDIAKGKNLWMSEVDGAYTEGLGEMSAALGLAKNMSKQLNGLIPSASGQNLFVL